MMKENKMKNNKWMVTVWVKPDGSKDFHAEIVWSGASMLKALREFRKAIKSGVSKCVKLEHRG